MTASDAKPARLRFVGESDLRATESALWLEALFGRTADDFAVRIQSIRRAMREDESASR